MFVVRYEPEMPAAEDGTLWGAILHQRLYDEGTTISRTLSPELVNCVDLLLSGDASRSFRGFQISPVSRLPYKPGLVQGETLGEFLLILSRHSGWENVYKKMPVEFTRALADVAVPRNLVDYARVPV
jgi:hypothetical protein